VTPARSAETALIFRSFYWIPTHSWVWARDQPRMGIPWQLDHQSRIGRRF